MEKKIESESGRKASITVYSDGSGFYTEFRCDLPLKRVPFDDQDEITEGLMNRLDQLKNGL